MSHALESITARLYPRRLNPARGVARPVSQGANPFSDALAGAGARRVGKYLVRAVQRRIRHRGAHRNDVRRDAGGHRVQRSGLPSAARAVVRRVAGSRATGTSPAIRRARRSCRTAWPWCSTIRRCGATPRRRIRSGTCAARAHLGADTRGATPDDAGEVLAGRIIELMRATGMPNGLTALGFGEDDVDALATGAEPQYRVIKNAPVDIGRPELQSLFRSALRYW